MIYSLLYYWQENRNPYKTLKIFYILGRREKSNKKRASRFRGTLRFRTTCTKARKGDAQKENGMLLRYSTTLVLNAVVLSCGQKILISECHEALIQMRDEECGIVVRGSGEVSRWRGARNLLREKLLSQDKKRLPRRHH